VDFAEPAVDQSTGTLRLRAIFPNEKGLLLAGLFVRIQVPLDTADEMLVPTMAIGSDQSGRYVLVVNSQNVVEPRPVRVGQTVDHMRVISQGVSESDWVVVNGIQRARPGFKVNPAQAGAAPAASAPAAPIPSKK
jgi:RND family efflux transporter MFP subunit